MNPVVLPGLLWEGFDGSNLDTLVGKGHVSLCEVGLEAALEKNHAPLSPHITQYVLIEKGGDQLPLCPRLKLDSAMHFLRPESVVDVRMAFCALDLDIKDADGKRREWEPKEFFRWYSYAVPRFPDLSRAIVYPSPHGAKVVWKISPLVHPSDDAWNGFYTEVCEKFAGFGPGGESPDRGRMPWTSTFRVPRGHDFHAEVVMYGSDYRAGLSLSDRWVDAFASGQQAMAQVSQMGMVANGPPIALPPSSSPPDASNVLAIRTALTDARALGEETAKELRELPLYKWAESNSATLEYKVWWFIGTNICAACDSLGDRGRSLWHEFSALDAARYTEAEADREFDGHLRYREAGKGPVTYKKFRDFLGPDTWEVIYGTELPRPSSSLAGSAARAARAKPTHSSVPPVDSDGGPLPPDKVRNLLSLKKVGAKGNYTYVVDRSRIHNLETILARDEHFHGRLSCDLLGAVDRWDMPSGEQKTMNDPDCLTNARSYISRNYGVDWGDTEMKKWFPAACFKKRYHPVQQYLYSLSWDGVDRVPELLKCMSAPADDYTAMVMRKWLIAAVARPLQMDTINVRDYSYLDDGRRIPMKVDEMLVLFGGQGSGDYGGKTAFFTVMANEMEWYTDNLPSLTGQRKDAAITVLDSWIIEMGEVDDAMSQNRKETMKRFLSSQMEKFRRPYDTGNRSWWRGCVFVGTTNKQQFLDDPSGDRRYLVVSVGQTIDVPAVRKIRDQLWAQATHMFEDGEVWWLQGAEKAMQDVANAEFRRLDAIEEYVAQWLALKKPVFTDEAGTFGPKGAKYPGGFTSMDVATQALGKLLGDATNKDLQRVGTTMYNLGYKKVRRMVDGVSTKVYLKL
jgi:predicted P-loop ATPase